MFLLEKIMIKARLFKFVSAFWVVSRGKFRKKMYAK